MSDSQKAQETLVSLARQALNEAWAAVSRLAAKRDPPDFVGNAALIEGIRAAVNSSTKSYRYVLPTQLAAKLADHALDCRSLQAARGGPGAFDARTIAHKVVVPFDQENERVLGGAPEPYVNNPLRVPEVSRSYRRQQKNKGDWDSLSSVLEAVEGAQDPAFTRSVLLQALLEVHRRLRDVQVVYPIPRRTSLRNALRIISDFLSESSGGDRLLAMGAALFGVIGKRFGLYPQVRRANVTAADSATGMSCDLECVSANGDVILAVELKDRDLTVTQMKGKMEAFREKQVSEIFFIAQGGVKESDRSEVDGTVDREFAAGQNVYITDLFALSQAALALLGEQGRRDFLAQVGSQLDSYGSDVAHRRTWAQLLRSV